MNLIPIKLQVSENNQKVEGVGISDDLQSTDDIFGGKTSLSPPPE